MKVQGNDYSNSYFNRGVKLVQSDEAKVNKLLVDLTKTKKSQDADMLKSKLLDIFDKHLQKETNKHSKRFIHKDDFQQNLYLKFLVLLEQVRTKVISPLSFVEEFNKNLRPTRDEKLEKEHSIDIPIKRDTLTKRVEFLAEDNLPVYVSQKSPQELSAIKRQTKKVLKDSILSSKERFILDKKSHGVTFVEISEETGKSITRVRQHYVSGLMKLKQKNNTVPPNVKDLADILGISEQEFVKFASKKPQIFAYKPDVFKNFIKKSVEVLGVSEQDFTKMILRQPSICCMRPERFRQNISALTKLFAVSEQKIIKSALRQPQILYCNVDTLMANISANAKVLGLSQDDFVKVALKLPQLFYQKSETLEKNIKDSAKLFGISEQEFLKAVAKQPQLVSQKAETLKQNVVDKAKLFNVAEKDIVKVAVKHPVLFYVKTESSKESIDEKVKILGITKKEFVKAGMHAPTIFFLKPETMYQNILESSKKLGMSEKKYIKQALKHPSLFYINPETMKNNVTKTAKLLGVSEKTFITATTITPALLYSKPETLKKNVEEISKVLHISEQEFVQEALKRPVLFGMKVENIDKKFKAMDFYAQFKKTVNNKKLYIAAYPITYVYNNTLTYLIKKDLKGVCNITQKNILDVMQDLPARNFHFSLPRHEITEDFIDYTKACFAQYYPKHNCSFAIVEKVGK